MASRTISDDLTEPNMNDYRSIIEKYLKVPDHFKQTKEAILEIVTNHTSYITRLESEKSLLNDNISKLELEIEKRKKECQETKQSYDRLIGEKDRRMKELQEENEKLKSSLEKKTEKLKATQDKFENITRTQSQTSIQNIQQATIIQGRGDSDELVNLRRENEELKTELNKVKTEVNRLNSKIADLQNRLNEELATSIPITEHGEQ